MNCPRCHRPAREVPSDDYRKHRFQCDPCRYTFDAVKCTVFEETGVHGDWDYARGG